MEPALAWFLPTPLKQRRQRRQPADTRGAAPHTGLPSTKRFTNLKVNLKRLGLYIGAKMQLVSYEFEYFYQCIMTFWGLRDSKGPILMHQAHLVQN